MRTSSIRYMTHEKCNNKNPLLNDVLRNRSARTVVMGEGGLFCAAWRVPGGRACLLSFLPKSLMPL